MTPRLWAPLFLAASVLAVLSGSAGGEPATKKQASTAAAGAERSTKPATAVERRGRRRPGCGRFCRQAGGFGAGPDDSQPLGIPRQEIRVARDRVFGVHARCRLNRKCIGAILVSAFHSGDELEYGRANLRIPPHTTRKVLIAITDRGLRFLRRHGRDRRAFAVAPLSYPRDVQVSVGLHITLVQPR